MSAAGEEETGPATAQETSEQERGRFNDADEILLAALAEGKTHEQAACLAGVSAKTVQRRRRSNVFRAELHERRRERMLEVTRRLGSTAAKAVDTLDEILDAGTRSEKLRAARTTLELLGRFHAEHSKQMGWH
jgi:hypothetical protein